jgi:hypothetical protein
MRDRRSAYYFDRRTTPTPLVPECVPDDVPEMFVKFVLPRVKRMALNNMYRQKKISAADFVAECTALAYRAFVQTERNGRTVEPFIIARSAVGQALRGERFASNCHAHRDSDALTAAQWYPARRDELVEELEAPPSDCADIRQDLERWLATLPPLRRMIVASFANGDKPKELARKVGMHPSNLASLRCELKRSFAEFTSH